MLPAAASVLPATAPDYGFWRPGQVSREALVAVEGNQYSVPVAHVGAPVTVRLHHRRVVIWRDAGLLAEHERAPDGAHRRVVIPEHFSPLFGRKPRAQVMLYRQALLDLGEVAAAYVTELSRRQRARLSPEILGLYALLQQHGPATLLGAMARAHEANAYGVEYLATLIAAPRAAPLSSPASGLPPLLVPGAPFQAEIDRQLALYEVYAHGAPLPATAVPS